MKYAATIIVCLFYLNIYAQTCCSGGVPIANNIGLPIANKGSVQFALSYDNNSLETLLSGTDELDDVNRKRHTKSILLESGYSITDNLSVDIFMSFVRQEREVTYLSTTTSSSTQGFGDMVVLLKYALINNKSFNLIVGGGPKFPTGKSNLTDDLGIVHIADMQPGSGALDWLGWYNVSLPLPFRKSMALSARGTYRFTGKNTSYLGSLTNEFGDEWQLIAGISDQFPVWRSVISPSVSFRFRQAQKDRSQDQKIEASGGDWVFIMPAVTLIALPNLSLNITTELPIYSRVNGTQLSPSYKFAFGVHYTIDLIQ